MSTVCVRLPWIVMRHVCAMPAGDVPRAAELVRAMGKFVGEPFDAASMRRAAAAQRETVAMIQRWEAEYTRAGTPGDMATGVFPFWLTRRTFPHATEFEANVVMILFAGTHNLENVLGHAVRLLLQHPEQLRRLRARPELLDNAVNEVLRFCPAIRVVPRTALRPVTLRDGSRVEEGETVLLSFYDANRDSEIHDCPDAFDIARPTAGRHLSFGMGHHLCNGHALARLQVKRLLEATVLGRYPHAALADGYGRQQWEHTYSHLAELPLVTRRGGARGAAAYAAPAAAAISWPAARLADEGAGAAPAPPRRAPSVGPPA